jgi:hypothetical protein
MPLEIADQVNISKRQLCGESRYLTIACNGARRASIFSLPTKETWWGYDTLQVDDPDGNELFFPVPTEDQPQTVTNNHDGCPTLKYNLTPTA